MRRWPSCARSPPCCVSSGGTRGADSAARHPPVAPDAIADLGALPRARIDDARALVTPQHPRAGERNAANCGIVRDNVTALRASSEAPAPTSNERLTD